MSLLTEAPTLTHGIFLLLAVGFALFFEMVNGFHDTANAVATVIYTHSLKPGVAVAWSGLWNLIGVLCSGGGVAFAVVALLPVELVIRAGTGAGLAMVFALLISAILWNLGTWYVGLPASSSHSLVGAILGVGMGNAMMKTGHFLGGGVNWTKAADVGASLVISPLLGFCAAALLLKLCRAFVHKPELYLPPDPGQPPPHWIRGLLVLTCTGVSFAHGCAVASRIPRAAGSSRRSTKTSWQGNRGNGTRGQGHPETCAPTHPCASPDGTGRTSNHHARFLPGSCRAVVSPPAP